MSRTWAIIVLTAWPLVGVTTSFVLGRRGHDFSSWARVAAFLGPLTIPAALASVRLEKPRERRVVHVGAPGSGEVDVLVGLDGSLESEAALMRALDLLGPRIRRLTLARVIDHDAVADDAGEASHEVRDAAARDLRDRAAIAAARNPDTVILAGDPTAALCTEAIAGGYDLLVVGTRGHGLSKALIGSTAARLARSAPVPVLMGNAGPVGAAGCRAEGARATVPAG